MTSFGREGVGIKSYNKPESVRITSSIEAQFTHDDLWRMGMSNMVTNSFKEKEFGEIVESGREVLYNRQVYDQGGFHVEMFKNPTGRAVTVIREIDVFDDIKVNILDDENSGNMQNLKEMKIVLPGNAEKIVVYEFCGPKPKIEISSLSLV